MATCLHAPRGLFGIHQDAAHKLCMTKHRDYGPGNIDQAGILGLIVRLGDKLARLKNILAEAGVTMEDTPEDALTKIQEATSTEDKFVDDLLDVANYGIIGRLWLWGQWRESGDRVYGMGYMAPDEDDPDRDVDIIDSKRVNRNVFVSGCQVGKTAAMANVIRSMVEVKFDPDGMAELKEIADNIAAAAGMIRGEEDHDAIDARAELVSHLQPYSKHAEAMVAIANARTDHLLELLDMVRAGRAYLPSDDTMADAVRKFGCKDKSLVDRWINETLTERFFPKRTGRPVLAEGNLQYMSANQNGAAITLAGPMDPDVIRVIPKDGRVGLVALGDGDGES